MPLKRSGATDGPYVESMPTVNGQSADDLGFIRLLIDNLVKAKRADPARIYVTGLSRGGLMTFTVACALADCIAAAAPRIAGMTEYQRDACRPAKAMPIIAVDSTNDRDLFYDGELAPASVSSRYLKRWNGCKMAAPGKNRKRPSTANPRTDQHLADRLD